MPLLIDSAYQIEPLPLGFSYFCTVSATPDECPSLYPDVCPSLYPEEYPNEYKAYPPPANKRIAAIAPIIISCFFVISIVVSE